MARKIAWHPSQEALASIMVPKNNSMRLKTELLDMQRWEEDGGQVIEGYVFSSSDQTFAQPIPMQIRRHVTSLQWNERLVIEPFQSNNGIFRDYTTAKGKPNG